MKAILASLGLVFLAGAAHADTCYSRTYSTQHLAKHPDQNVVFLGMSFQ